MSKMIPQETINVLRQYTNLAVDTYGYDCTLYIPNNLNTIENYDVYVKPSDFAYKTYNTSVFIEWSPDVKRLRKIGVFTEDEIPMIAWFKNLPDVVRGSYFKINVQHIPGKTVEEDEFEIVDELIKGMGDMVALYGYKIAPKRTKR